jgi:hypothetical protein
MKLLQAIQDTLKEGISYFSKTNLKELLVVLALYVWPIPTWFVMIWKLGLLEIQNVGWLLLAVFSFSILFTLWIVFWLIVMDKMDRT